MRVKITADSTCDLSGELLEEKNITVMPLHVLLGQEVLEDGVTCTPEKIFQYVKETGGTYNSAAANPMEYYEFFTPFSRDYDAVIHISVGAGFSSCCQNARLAAADLPNVTVVDSRNVCTGQGYLVLRAADMAAAGCGPEEICAEVEDLAGRVELSFVLDRLDYLSKSGRCPTILAFGSNLLKIRPCVECVDGELKVVRKYRGPTVKCVAQYVKERLADRTDLDRDLIIISSCLPLEGCVEAERQAIAEYGPFRRCYETAIGSTIGSHCGPGTIGVVVARKAAEKET